MKNTVKLLSVALCLIVFLVNYNSIWAQQTQSSKRISERNSKLFKELKLSKPQQTRLTNIIRNYKKQKEEMIKKSSKKSKRKKLKNLRRLTKIEIGNILTCEQKLTLKNHERKKIRKALKHHS